MDRIIDNVFLGNIEDVKNITELLKNNIRIVINLSPQGCSIIDNSYSVVYVHIPIYWDDVHPPSKKFLEDIAIMVFHIINGTSEETGIMISCLAGMERSPLILAMSFYISEELKGTSPDFQKIYDLIKRKHPQTLDRTQWLR